MLRFGFKDEFKNNLAKSKHGFEIFWQINITRLNLKHNRWEMDQL